MNTKTLGNIGEKHALKFIHTKNYKILATNFYSRFGEIDIIAIDYSLPKPQTVHIEVKTRSNTNFGLPSESITPRKIKKIIKTALHFMNTSTLSFPFSWRIDLIALQLNKQGNLITISHIKNILDG